MSSIVVLLPLSSPKYYNNTIRDIMVEAMIEAGRVKPENLQIRGLSYAYVIGEGKKNRGMHF